MRNDFLIRFLNEYPMAIQPSKLAQIQAFLEFRLAGGPRVEFEAQQAPSYQVAGAVAVLPIFGTIIPRADAFTDMSGGASLERAAARLRQALEDPAVGAIVLDIDSPGGSVYGVQEFAQEVYAARGRKKIIAVADALAASAAYWIGSAAEQFVVTPSGEVGSIGVVAMHVDYSERLKTEGLKVTFIHAGEHKVEGNAYEPLEDDARAFIQKRVDEYHDAFVGTVARNRGVTKATVLKEFGQGRVYGAAEAKERGMVDRVAPLVEVIRGLQPRAARPNRSALAAEADIAEAVLKAS